jgi:predicted TIM-barrel fold metal-dependent hydrolase
MIIDAHAHWLPPEILANAHFYDSRWGDIDAHIQMMHANGISKTVLTYPTTDAHVNSLRAREVSRNYNDALAGIVKRYPDSFIGAAVPPMGDPGEMIDELLRAFEELGLPAISLPTSFKGMYLDAPFFDPVLSIAADRNIPVFVHSQTFDPIGGERIDDPLLTPVIRYVFDTTVCIGKMMMEGTLRHYDDTSFIFNYFGGAISLLANRFDATYTMLRSMNFVKDLETAPSVLLKKIYVDTGGETGRANLLSCLELVDPSHIVWGSDWPAKTAIRESMDSITALNLPAKEKEGIMGLNCASLFR